jgi:hypothetical protein
VEIILRVQLQLSAGAAKIFLEQEDNATGYAWNAREPQLMCGAKGRASSHRSTDYHISFH